MRGDSRVERPARNLAAATRLVAIPLMMKFRADASLMRISRQIERDEMCYRNDEGVIPFRRKQATNKEAHLAPRYLFSGRRHFKPSQLVKLLICEMEV